jgi:aryl-alcohol dehydrogenase-like predicted oxidoreductase
VEYRRIGSSDLVVSAVGLRWEGDLYDEAQAALEAAIESWVTYFDVTLNHEPRNEPLLAEVLEGRRDDFVVAASRGWYEEEHDFFPGSREDVRLGIELALERLRTEYVDLFLYAPPDGYRHHVRDGGPRLEETLAAMHELVEEGKARALALACLRSEDLSELEDIARIAGSLPIVALQSPYNILYRMAEIGPFSLWRWPEHEVLPFCDRHGIGFLPSNPLAGGLLTGQYRRDAHAYIGINRITKETYERIARLERFVQERDRTLPELAIAALVSMGFPSVVADIGPTMELDGVDWASWASATEQVRAAVAAADWGLTPEDLGELARIR